MDRLKPCPFCGKSPSIRVAGFRDIDCDYSSGDTVVKHVKRYRVGCGYALCLCHPQTCLYDAQEEAIEAWNRRADNG
uniref:Restriction alleviation protein n=1 Tax=Siphoviridae sp. ctClL93 TaxID=2825381 RepID=A0A8S5VDR2_9CAUD|nr:MAG TPA: restriction alleviation protein [Siphoviridae sp. ctClL93]